jgi:hypothetical protein
MAVPKSDQKAYEDRVAAAIAGMDNEVVPVMAQWVSPVPGQKAVKGQAERSLYWEADPTVDVNLLRAGGHTPEQIQTLLQIDPRATEETVQTQLQTTGRLTEEQIGLLKFPHRSILMQSGGRADDVDKQVKYVNDMVRQGAPETHPDDPFAEIRDKLQASPPPPVLPDSAPQSAPAGMPPAPPAGIQGLQQAPMAPPQGAPTIPGGPAPVMGG